MKNKKTIKLKKAVREAINSRNTIERMGKNVNMHNPYSTAYLNWCANHTMRLAQKAHPLMPYYLATRKI